MKKNTHIYPLRFREILRTYRFGGRWIPEAFPAKGPFPTQGRVSETWEVCDRPNGNSSEILNGPLAGKTLHDAIELWGGDLLGTDVVARFGNVFPLLIKFLDVSNPLLEQVHASDADVARLGLDDHFGKTEAWHIVRTRPDVVVQCGLRKDATRDEIKEALLEHTAPSIMQPFTPGPGDTFLLKAGTPHASTGGMLMYEIMQNSDVCTVLRVPVQDLEPDERDARADAIMDVIGLDSRDVGPTRLSPLDGGQAWEGAPALPEDGLERGRGFHAANTRFLAVECEQFRLEQWVLGGTVCLLPPDSTGFRVITVIDGSVRLHWDGAPEVLEAGQTILIPAALPQASLDPGDSAATLLVASVPREGKRL